MYRKITMTLTDRILQWRKFRAQIIARYRLKIEQRKEIEQAEQN